MRILGIIDKILSLFSPQYKLYRLKRLADRLEDKLYEAYERGDADLFGKLYYRLKRVRWQIRDLENIK